MSPSLRSRIVSNGFYGGNPLPHCRRNGRDARARRLPVDVNRARPAQAHAAAEFRAGHAEHVAQGPQQRHVVGNIEVAGLSVYVERNHRRLPTARERALSHLKSRRESIGRWC